MLDKFIHLPIMLQMVLIFAFAITGSVLGVNAVVHRKKIACWAGWHKYKIELSEYVSFNYRNVYCKCQKCGATTRTQMHHDRVYPIETSDEFRVKEYKEKNNIKN